MLSYSVALTFGGSPWNVSFGCDFCGDPLGVSFGRSPGEMPWGDPLGGLPKPLGILDPGGPLGGIPRGSRGGSPGVYLQGNPLRGILGDAGVRCRPSRAVSAVPWPRSPLQPCRRRRHGHQRGCRDDCNHGLRNQVDLEIQREGRPIDNTYNESAVKRSLLAICKA